MAGLAALQYGADGFDTRTAEIVGRRMAGETFLKAWIAHAGADPLTGWADDATARDAFVAHVRELGVTGPVVCATQRDAGALTHAGALWLADPAIATYAWHRRWVGQDRWSIVGITHTMSSHAAMDRVAALLTAPTQRWDALICTSRAVERAVTAVLDAEADYLTARVGATACSAPELPVIPLGVACNALAPDPAARARWRAELGIADDAVAVLQFGRLSMHTKSHPLPLFLALGRAAARGGPPLHLILAGRFANPSQEQTHHALAAHFADVLTTHFVDGARPDAGGTRSAADIGTLLSDNVQESYGLAPVELMAAGLPVVGSDWDGLRDTIEHDVTGMLVPTLLPPPGAGDLIARRHAVGIETAAQFMAAAAQSTAIDIAKAAEAFAALAADAGLRARMGEAGRRRARALYDWPVVIGQYRALLDHLAARRHAGTGERAPVPRRGAALPARMDPFAMFAAYPSGRLDPAMRLDRAPGSPASVLDMPGGLGHALMVQSSLPSAAALDTLLARIGGGGLVLGDLLAACPVADRGPLLNGIVWLMKFGFVTHT